MRKLGKILWSVFMCSLVFSFCACGVDAVKTVAEIAVGETQTEYFEGDAFGGGKLAVTYTDNTTETVNITADMLSGFDTSTAGEKKVTVTYGGKTATFNITVREKFTIATETDFDVTAALADTEENKWGGVTVQTVFDSQNKFLSFREKSNASVAYLVKGMSTGVMEMKMKVDVRSDTTATVTFSNQSNAPADFFYERGGRNYSLEFASDGKMYVKKWINGEETALSGAKPSAAIPMMLSNAFTTVKIEVAETNGAVNIDVTVDTKKLLSVTDGSSPILGGGAVGFSYMGTGGMAIGGADSVAANYVAPEPLGLNVYESPNVEKATADVDLLADFSNTWTGRERIFNTVKEDNGVRFTSKDNPEEPQAGVTEFQGLYNNKIFGDVQLEYSFNVISHGEWIMFWFRCVPERSDNVSIWGNKKTNENSNSYSVLITPDGTVQFHKWAGRTQIYLNGTGTKLPGSVTAQLQDGKAVNTVKMSIENITQAGRDAVELRFQLNNGEVLSVQDTDKTVFLNAGYVGVQGYAINNGTSSVRLLSATAKQEITL